MPNTFARTLAGKKSNTIGLFFVVTGETFQNSRIARNDYFSSYLNYLVDIANGMDYYVLVNTISVPEDYEKVNQAFLEKRIDGGVLIGTQDDTLSKIHLDNIKSPMIIFDYDLKSIKEQHYDHQQISIVNSLDSRGMDKAVKYLKEKGHKRIGFIKGNMLTRSARVRYEGFIEAMRKHGIDLDPSYHIEGEFSATIAYNEMKKAIIKGDLPDAFISSNDYMAVEAMKALQEEGIRVPEDVSIMGFDNVHMSEQVTPALTTLEPKFYDMAKQAIELLDHRLQSPETQIEQVYEFSVDIVERQSC